MFHFITPIPDGYASGTTNPHAKMRKSGKCKKSHSGNTKLVVIRQTPGPTNQKREIAIRISFFVVYGVCDIKKASA